MDEERQLDPPEPQGALDILFGVLFAPRATFAAIRTNPPYGLAVAVFGVAGAVEALVASRSLPSAWPPGLAEFAPELDASALVGPFALAGLLLNVLLWAVLTGLFHLAAELAGARGSIGSLFALLGLSHLPLVLTAPVFMLRNMGLAGAGLLAVSLDVWRFILYYRSIRANYGLSRGRALVVWLAPGLLLTAVFAILMLFLIATFGSMLPGDLLPLPFLR